MRVLFVNCVDFLESSLPEGIALLSSILKKHGHAVEIFDTAFLKPKDYELDKKANEVIFHKTTPYTLRDLIANEPEVDIAEKFSATIEEFKPSLIAISTMTTNYAKSMDLMKRVKLPCRVIFGGTHPTLMPEKVLKERGVDFVCVGDGDEALLELCDKIDSGGDASKVKNIFMKTSIGNAPKIIRNRLRPFTDLDLLPAPDLSIFDPRHFFRPFMGDIYKGIFMSTSRGCPRGCAYCVNNRLRDLFKECGQRYIRFQSPKIVARNIKTLKEEYGIEWYKFSDDTFLMRPLKDIYELKSLLRPLGIMFGCSVDPVTVTSEKVRLAKEMGCISMTIGVETGNENMRKLVLGRHISDRHIKEAINIIRDHDIKISTFNMIGVPGETKENVYETIRLNKELGVPDANVYILYPFPGTKIYYDSKISFDNYGYIPPMEDAHIFNLSRMSKEDLSFFLRMFNLFLVLPESYWDKIERARDDVELYKELVTIAQNIVDKRTSYANA